MPHDHAETPDWRTNGVRIVKAGELDPNTAQTPGMTRVPLAFARITRAPNTLDAHRLIHWAAAEGAQTRVAMALFARYFGAGEDISDPAVLAAVAAEAGLDAAAIARLLAGDTDRAEVTGEAEAARRAGITGVPAFIVGGQYAVTGAQPQAFWTDFAREIAAATPPA